jgi:hypothetical protein
MLRTRQIVALRALIDDLSTIDGWPDVSLNAPLLIHDLLCALDVSESDRSAIVSDGLDHYITRLLNSRHSPAPRGCS